MSFIGSKENMDKTGTMARKTFAGQISSFAVRIWGRSTNITPAPLPVAESEPLGRKLFPRARAIRTWIVPNGVAIPCVVAIAIPTRFPWPSSVAVPPRIAIPQPFRVQFEKFLHAARVPPVQVAPKTFPQLAHKMLELLAVGLLSRIGFCL